MTIMGNSADGSMTTFDKWRMAFGFLALIIIGTIILCIALGKVEEKTSYGLLPALTMFSTVLGFFANWAFSKGNGNGNDKR